MRAIPEGFPEVTGRLWRPVNCAPLLVSTWAGTGATHRGGKRRADRLSGAHRDDLGHDDEPGVVIDPGHERALTVGQRDTLDEPSCHRCIGFWRCQGRVGHSVGFAVPTYGVVLIGACWVVVGEAERGVWSGQVPRGAPLIVWACRINRHLGGEPFVAR
ncbi:hypothetical protein F4561_005190 [Lipingzhangella halophila]|uniref:Uncharacterized protein n=1 Tax=Lipingzhangella halophila TaxID=1783352 RepID=A0A7W7RLU2_9ACTN|nr:hypothetical protein [Lipingzhangella halophila]